ncbi:caspase family protein [Pantanalinema rosaneae CENA516]|uniref:nSTAND1 domain-containing NTPase n=1 Tax=Pantanalinema rosaneae TaxID=1620701 RepID=UPI003D6E7234
MSRDALVVGISSYQHLPSLGAPAQDAEAIAQQLESYGDFRVTRLPEMVKEGHLQVGMKTPVTLAPLEAALVQLFKPKGNNIPHTALFYFSGHGLQKEAGIREGFLATSEVNPQAHFYGLSLFWLRRLLQESPVRQRIILLDCCHSGEILNFLEADPGAKSGTDRLFMAASREYESAYESIAGNYSVFTQALINGLDPRRLANGIVSNYALTDWVSSALKGEVQQPLFENSGSEIILTRCQSAETVLQTSLSQEICPYRGLEFFDEHHADYFFGREELTDQLIDKLKTGNFLAVVGASGSGKSSLVRAGLVHKLRRGQRLSGSSDWQIKLITPTEQPLKSLANAFINPTAAAVDRAEQLRRAEIFLQEGGTGLSQLVRASLMSNPSKHSRLVLIIDQFEEVFTLCQSPHAERDRHRFFNCLTTALREVGDRLSIVIVLRADFFSKCSLYNGLAEQIEQFLVMVTPLTYEQIKASITKPAEKVGLVCEPNLVYNILLDVAGSPGELPLLQYTLLELWYHRQIDPSGGASRLTLNAYTELGGVRGTLQKRADEVFYSLTPEEQQVAKRIFIALTQLGEGTEDTRRRILKSELVGSRLSIDLVDRVLEKLVAAKLVVTNQVPTTSRHQECLDQRFANVSTALRLAQMVKSKSPQSAQDLERSLPKHHTTLNQGSNHSIARLAYLPDLEVFYASPGVGGQETVDIAHEALIRNWTLLRSWLDENREMLRRQRGIERAAREWDSAGQPRAAEYLLRGNRLLNAADFLDTYADDLSALAQRYIAVSQEEHHQARRELRLLQVAVPCTLLVALAVTCIQYWTAMRSQAEKDYQLQVATSRQWAAIAQSTLQETNSDPATALLISRLAAQQGQTYEAEASLRAALQKLRLQADLRGHQGAVSQVIFADNHHRLATAGDDGTIRFWSIASPTVERVLSWDEEREGVAQPPITTIAFTGDQQRLVASAQTRNQVQVWSVESGARLLQLGGFRQPVTHLAVNGNWIAAASADRTIQVWQADTGKLQARFIQTTPATGLSFSSDGQQLLAISGNTVQVWQVATKQTKQLLRHAGGVTSATFDATAQVVVTGTQDGTIRAWDVATGKVQQTLNPGMAAIAQICLSPNGQYFAISDVTQRVWLWHFPKGQLFSIQGVGGSGQRSQEPVAIAFSPNSQRLSTTQVRRVDNRLSYVTYLWDVRTQRSVGSLWEHTGSIRSVQFDSNGSLVATASADGSVRLWAADMGGELPSFTLPHEVIRWVTFLKSPATTPDSMLSAAAAAIQGSSTPAPATHPLANALVTVGMHGTLHHWHLSQWRGSSSDSRPPVEATPASRLPLGLNWLQPWNGSPSPLFADGSRLSSQRTNPVESVGMNRQQLGTSKIAANGATVRDREVVQIAHAGGAALLDVASFFPPSGNTLMSVALSADGQLVATADSVGQVKIWQPRPDQPQPTEVSTRILEASGAATNRVQQLVFSPDQRVILGIENDRTIQLWDVQSGKRLQSLQGHQGTIGDAQFSPDGRQVISASQDGTVRIWDLASGQSTMTLTQPTAVMSGHFSPDGQRVVTAGLDGTAKIFDPHTGALRVILAGHRGAVLDAEFSPDGKMLVTASTDGTARLWDADTGTERALLRPVEAGNQLDPLQRAFFSPDGQMVVTLNSTGTVQVWAATWNGLLKLAHDRTLRPLRPEECLRYLRLPPNACPSSDWK